jgi:dTDP-4-dehydrorhamnose 3,5-epimerase
MEFQKVEHIPDLVIVTFKAYFDDRGYFEETYDEDKFKEAGLPTNWVKDNHSHSIEGVLRGMHWQVEPHAQDKFVRVIRGKAIDVAVDIRTDSPTYGQFHMVELTEDNHTGFFIPKGFAHGFLALTDNVEFEYKVSGKYDKASERSFRWDDPDVNIPWGTDTPILSDKDAQAPLLGELKEEDLFKLNSIKNE